MPLSATASKRGFQLPVSLLSGISCIMRTCITAQAKENKSKIRLRAHVLSTYYNQYTTQQKLLLYRWFHVIIPLVLANCNFPLVSFMLPFVDATSWSNFPTAFCSSQRASHRDTKESGRVSSFRLYSEWKDTNDGSNTWQSINDIYGEQEDWREMLTKKEDGTFWKSIDDDEENDDTEGVDMSPSRTVSEDDESEAWLDTLAGLAAEEVEFNLREAERADKARQMQEWGFEDEVIESTLGVAIDSSLETTDEVEGMQSYREESYLDDIDVDLTTVESHAMVEKDPETGDPIRTQMVYVDEHTCIGCTNCAMIAQSTFFMDDEHGRARVFQQWGDTDETIEIAIQTCPVDCIHYVPYEELVRLEVERRDQNINFKARLVSQGEYSGVGLSHKVGGANAFTGPQQISGNMGARCSNCPSRGCKNCPMYGVGKNPEYEQREKMRKERMAKNRLQRERESKEKSVDL